MRVVLILAGAFSTVVIPGCTPPQGGFLPTTDALSIGRMPCAQVGVEVNSSARRISSRREWMPSFS